jgi:hypothetical protein
MKYRILPTEEWHRAAELVEATLGVAADQSTLPGPDSASLMVAEEDGEIKALGFLQQVTHFEPFMCQPGYATQFVEMNKVLGETLPDGVVYYVFADPAVPDEVAREAGLDDLDVRVFFRRVGG